MIAASALAGFLAFSAPAPVLAQDTGKVILRVDDIDITEGELALAAQDFASQLQRVPPEAQRQVLASALIDMHLLARAGEEAGLADSESFQFRLAFLKARALRTAYIVDKISASITDDDIKTAYDAAVKDFVPQDEAKARHILVASKEDAEAIIKALEGGADFATLATEKSTGPSASEGGDLGWFAPGRMVPSFDAAVFALEPGSYTKEPVETRFGWHVIMLEEKRQSQPPALDQVSEALREQLVQDHFVTEVKAMREAATVEYVDETLKPVEAPTQQ